jgi:alkylation response protein AidB-like acyl-CoA dehydrogenase
MTNAMESTNKSAASFTLPPEVVEYRDLVRRIVRDEMMPLEGAYLKNCSYGVEPAAAIRKSLGNDVADRLEKISRDTGLWYMMVPEEHGGLGLDHLTQMVMEEELYYCAPHLPRAFVPSILFECKGDQVERYLKPTIEGKKQAAFAQSEANAGSDPGGMMKTNAKRDNGSWVLNGTKMWISNAASCNFLMVQAVTDFEKRQHGGITMFLVDRNAPGVTVEQPGIPTWLADTPEQYIVHFDDVRISDEQVLGEVGKGFIMGQKFLAIHDRLSRGPYAVGKMQRALDMSVEWAKQRVTFGKPISERQAIQWMLVDMHIDTRALRAMIYETASRADAGEEVRYDAAMVKLCAGEWGGRCLDRAIQIHGAMGESLELPLTVFYRHLRHAQIGGGTNEIQRMLIARSLLRK